jgi:hypothetical protein
MSEAKDPKERFREALEKKKTGPKGGSKGAKGQSKIQGGNSAANAPKMFRRKSGSS